mmetsp:Transcript_95279/g.269326  ORF Transcript_95279/g.269326 Transcript_95279/m.269326 type:complete len:231 (+) Transcript_95279:521-1213(+)
MHRLGVRNHAILGREARRRAPHVPIGDHLPARRNLQHVGARLLLHELLQSLDLAFRCGTSRPLFEFGRNAPHADFNMVIVACLAPNSVLVKVRLTFCASFALVLEMRINFLVKADFAHPISNSGNHLFWKGFCAELQADFLSYHAPRALKNRNHLELFKVCDLHGVHQLFDMRRAHRTRLLGPLVHFFLWILLGLTPHRRRLVLASGGEQAKHAATGRPGAIGSTRIRHG